MKKKIKTFKKFEDWHPADIWERLHIHLQKEMNGLSDWLDVKGSIPQHWKSNITDLQTRLRYYYNNWNEIELLARFISPILETIGFTGKKYNLFHERKLAAVVQNYPVSGYVDGMVASGQYEPESPYFFIHEYKKIKGTDADPEGQLLITMLAARTLSETTEPLYGCFVLGKFWHFVYLEGNKYCVSEWFDATSEEKLTII